MDRTVMDRVVYPYRLLPAKKRPSGGRLDTPENIQDMADIMHQEAGYTGELSQVAVGWTLKNRMLRNGVTRVRDAWRGYQHSATDDLTLRRLAQEVLSGSIPDPTHGATHFYTPQAMPKEGGTLRGDVGGGLEDVPDVVDLQHRHVRNYRPIWTRSFLQKDLPGVKEKFFKFYEQPGRGHTY